MNEEKAHDLIHQHDKDISTLANSVEHLVSGIKALTSDVKDVVAGLSDQNVLAERMNNIHQNIIDAFHDRDISRDNFQKEIREELSGIHEVQVSKGCPSMGIALVELDTKVTRAGYARLAMGISVGMAALSFTFGYLYIDMAELNNNIEDVHKELGQAKIELSIADNILVKKVYAMDKEVTARSVITIEFIKSFKELRKDFIAHEKNEIHKSNQR